LQILMVNCYLLMRDGGIPCPYHAYEVLHNAHAKQLGRIGNW
jgi:hypothetical protein